jgi:formylglycine-generating enzyme required for sulfatase activity
LYTARLLFDTREPAMTATAEFAPVKTYPPNGYGLYDMAR